MSDDRRALPDLDGFTVAILAFVLINDQNIQERGAQETREHERRMSTPPPPDNEVRITGKFAPSPTESTGDVRGHHW